MVALLVQNMERLDEQVKEEADGIYNTLGKEMYANALIMKLHPQANYHQQKQKMHFHDFIP